MSRSEPILWEVMGLNPIRGSSSLSASLFIIPGNFHIWHLLLTYNSQILFCNPSFSSAVGFCFIFASFLMLLTTICFLIGAPVQTVCESIQSGDIYAKVCEMRTSFWNLHIFMYTHDPDLKRKKVHGLPAVWLLVHSREPMAGSFTPRQVRICWIHTNMFIFYSLIDWPQNLINILQIIAVVGMHFALPQCIYKNKRWIWHGLKLQSM